MAWKGEGYRRAVRTRTATWSSAITGFTVRLDQALLLRGSREFAAVDEYRAFLGKLFEQLNSGRKARAGGRDGPASCSARPSSGYRQASALAGKHWEPNLDGT